MQNCAIRENRLDACFYHLCPRQAGGDGVDTQPGGRELMGACSELLKYNRDCVAPWAKIIGEAASCSFECGVCSRESGAAFSGAA